MNAGRISEKKHWDNFWNKSPSVDQIYPNQGRVREHLEDVVSLEGKKILEVGAGTGRDGIDMAESGAWVISLDYSQSSLEMIASQTGMESRVAPCCGDGFALPFREDSFDIVFHQGLLEHFRNPGDMLAENFRVLKPGGYLLVDVPQKFHYYTIIKHIMIAAGKWFAGWETEYTVGELEWMMKEESFRPVSFYGEWMNPPIWYRMLRRLLLYGGLTIPMYPALFRFYGRKLGGIRRWLSRRRWAAYFAVVIGVIAVKKAEGGGN